MTLVAWVVKERRESVLATCEVDDDVGRLEMRLEHRRNLDEHSVRSEVAGESRVSVPTMSQIIVANCTHDSADCEHDLGERYL